MTVHDTRLPAGSQGHDAADGSAMAEAVKSVRLEYSSQERSDGWLRWAGEDGVSRESRRLAEFIAAIPCFTPYVALATDRGPCFATKLRPGDRVVTRDHGLQEVRWVGQRRFGWRDLGLNPTLRPVRIAAGALGNGVPAADMLVSPNHRFLAAMPGQKLTDATEQLWQARELIGREGVHRVDCTDIEYVQILLDRHELVLSEGAWSESFQPSGARLAALAPEAQAELRAQMPELAQTEPERFAVVRPEALGAESI
jgi:hypothetical protein